MADNPENLYEENQSALFCTPFLFISEVNIYLKHIIRNLPLAEADVQAYY